MSRLPLSLLLMRAASSVLAALMLLVAVLLIILVLLNTLRGDSAANTHLMIVAVCFACGGAGFYALRRWASRAATVSRGT